MASYIRRRKFLAMLGGGAAAWPLAARAQHTRVADASPRIAFLTLGLQENYPAFVDGLSRLGYAQGRNLDIDYRAAIHIPANYPQSAGVPLDLVRHRATCSAKILWLTH